MNPYRKRPNSFMQLVQSMGGLAANIAGHTDNEIREIRDWCEHLLIARRKARQKEEGM